MVLALVNVPPPFVMMPFASRLTMLAPAALLNVTRPAMNAPSPPAPLVVIAPRLVMMSGVVSTEAIPCAFWPEIEIVSVFVIVLWPDDGAG